MKTKERKEVQQRFMNGEFHVIVATKAFGLGIDKPDIRFIVHFNFPDCIESYYQEIGRAGRDGNVARCPLLYRLEDRRIQGYFLGGKYPRREHSQRIYDIVASGSQGHDGVNAMCAASGIPKRKIKVILSQLEGSGIIERRGGRIKCVRSFASARELHAFLSEYEQRHTSDRERLDQMMRYAETTFCRTRFLREYFGEVSGSDCEHCDNCRAKSERKSQCATAEVVPGPKDGAVAAKLMPEAVHTARAARLFHIGDRVRHRRFGTGQVIEITGQNLTVDFGDAGCKQIRHQYVQRAA
jgi:ATP-dependent DNA helicase RecQ